MSEMFDFCKQVGRDSKHLFQKLLPIQQVTKELHYPMFISEKFDGVFCCYVRDKNDVGHIVSRTGKEYFSMEHLKPELAEYMPDPTDMLLFEAYIPDVPQSIISGACRDTKKQHPELLAYLHTEVSKYGIYRLMFDMGDMFDWEECDRQNIEPMSATPHVFGIRHFEIYNRQSLDEFVNYVWDNGGEGAVVHVSALSRYDYGKRNARMMKVKRNLSYDLRVINVFEGQGKYKGTLGGLYVKWKDGKTIKISGMTDDERHKWWKHPSDIVGKIVQVDAMSATSAGLLREPRFKGVRYDKEVADFEDIG